MNLTTIISCMAASVICGCAASNRRLPGETTVAVKTQRVGLTVETISYHWEDDGVEVSFTQRDGDQRWGMTIRDSWDTYRQFRDEARVWGPSTSKCSEEECLQIIDQSLKRFHSEKPGARFDYVAIEMQIIRELWSQILAGLGQRLQRMDGKVSSEPGDIPAEIHDEIRRVLDQSTTVSRTKAALNRRGLHPRAVGVASQLLFRSSVSGRKWTEIATAPGLGIEVPGVFEFDIGDDHIRPMTKKVFSP